VPARTRRRISPPKPDVLREGPQFGAFLPAALMYFLSGKPRYFYSGVDTIGLLASDGLIRDGNAPLTAGAVRHIYECCRCGACRTNTRAMAKQANSRRRHFEFRPYLVQVFQRTKFSPRAKFGAVRLPQPRRWGLPGHGVADIPHLGWLSPDRPRQRVALAPAGDVLDGKYGKVGMAFIATVGGRAHAA
jgi:hypothetical protein